MVVNYLSLPLLACKRGVSVLPMVIKAPSFQFLESQLKTKA